MKRSIIFMLFFFQFVCQGQVVPIYRPWNSTTNQYDPAVQVFGTSDIISDYGMRVTDGTRFHMGVDYMGAAREGDAILSLTAGKVTFIDRDNPKYIVIDGRFTDPQQPNQMNNPNGLIFAYLHIFPNAGVLQSNCFVMTTVLHGGETLPVIINTQTHVALARIAGLNVSHQQIQYTTTNMVVHEQPIAPIGRSGTLSPHLHLSLLESGTEHRAAEYSIDPWNQVNHPDNPLGIRIRRRNAAGFQEHSCEFDQGAPIWDAQIQLNYENQGRNILEGEVNMPGVTAVANNPDRYTNSVMNESKISWLIKNINADANFVKIRGRNYTSEYIIDPVGNREIYPAQMYNFNNGGNRRGRYGGVQLGENGCLPFAYRTHGDGGFIMNPQHPEGHGHPHDYYFFPDFYPRVATNHAESPTAPLLLAHYPWTALYKDGNYQMIGRVENTEGDIYESAINQFNIDNFPPFVKSVGVHFGNGACDNNGVSTQQPIYYRNWSPIGDGKIRLEPVEKRAVYGSDPGNLLVYATTSERMSGVLKARVPALSSNWVNGVDKGVDAVSGVHKWEFNFGANFTYQNGACYQIEFEGRDLAGNQLLKFELPCTGGTLEKTVPTRNGAGTNAWENPHVQGNDLAHGFEFYRCIAPPRGPDPEPVNCSACITSIDVLIKTVYASGVGSSDGAINVTIIGNHPNVVITWTKEDGTFISNNEDLTNIEAGVYCVKIEEGCCSISGCYNIGTCGSSLTLQKTDPTPENPSGGSVYSVIENGYEPYRYTWSNGTHAPRLTNLTEGTYCVSVTDNMGCVLEGCTNLVLCNPIEVAASFDESPPSECNATDGSLRILTRSASGGLAPYTYSMMNSSGQVILPNSLGQYNNLPADMYCLVATDSKGCTGQTCVDFMEHLSPEVTVETTKSCTNVANGFISVVALSGSNSTYNFEWSTGEVTYGSIESILSDIPAGEYCVTISSTNNGCKSTQCINVDEDPSTGPLNVESILQDACSVRPNGSITLSVTGGVAPYTYQWEGPGVTGTYTPSPQNLRNGNYSVTITDRCGESIIKSYELRGIQISNMTVTSGCHNGGQSTVTAIGGNLPYTYLWDNGQTTMNANSLATGNHCVTVTDNIGCAAIDCIDIVNNEIIVERTNECVGMSDGSVQITIHNPSQGAVEVVFNGQTYYNENPAPAEFSLLIENLSVGTFDLQTIISDCGAAASSTVRINPQYVTDGFVSYDENAHLCTYQQFCRDQPIEGSIVVSEPTYDFLSAHGGFFDACTVPILCNGTIVDNNYSEGFATVRAAEYMVLLTQAAAWLAPDYWSHLNETAISKDLHNFDCTRVTFCPYNMEIVGLVADITGTNAYEDPENPGCFILDCVPLNPWRDNDFCVDESIEEHLPFTGEIIEECKPRRANIAQLIQYFDQIQGIESTELGVFLQSDEARNNANCSSVVFCLSDFRILSTDINPNCCPEVRTISLWWLDENILAYEGHPNYENSDIQRFYDDNFHLLYEKRCAEIIFCLSTLEIFSTDINTVDCSNVPSNWSGGTSGCQIANDCSGQSSECGIVMCFDQNSDNNIIQYCGDIPMTGTTFNTCDPPFQLPGLTGGGDERILRKRLAYPASGAEFIEFSKSFLAGEAYPDGIVDILGERKLLDESPTLTELYHNIPNVDHMIRDVYNKHDLTFVEHSIIRGDYIIKHISSLNDWEKSIRSDSLTIQYFDQLDSSYVIGGTFENVLRFDRSVLATTSNIGGYLIYLDKYGSIFKYHIFEGLDRINAFSFTRSSDQIHMLAHRQIGGDVTVDGVNLQNGNGNFSYFVSGISQPVSNPIRSRLLNETQRLLAFAVSDVSQNAILYLTPSTSNLDFDSLTITAGNNANSYFWTKRFAQRGIDANDISLLYLGGDTLLAAVTYTGTIEIDNQQFSSQGEEDILFLFISPTGNIIQSLQYGTPEMENVSDLFLTDDYIYFAGEFEGSSERSIGMIRFDAANYSTSNPYISLIPKSGLSDVDQRAIEPDGKLRNSTTPGFDVYPNPFSGDFNLTINSPENHPLTIEVKDIYGRLIYRKDLIVNDGINQFIIPTEKINSTGTFYIMVKSKFPELNRTKKIVSIKH
jgi:SprB repeat